MALRRLTLEQTPDIEYCDIIQPEQVTTWVDITKSQEQAYSSSSWMNDLEAKACAKICHQVTKVIHKSESVVVITRFTAQKQAIRNYLQLMGHKAYRR